MRKKARSILPFMLLLFGMMNPHVASAETAATEDEEFQTSEVVLEEKEDSETKESDDVADENTITENEETTTEAPAEETEDVVETDEAATEENEETLSTVEMEAVESEELAAKATEDLVHTIKPTEDLDLPKETPDIVLEEEAIEEKQVRVVIELDGQPLIEEATRQGIRVDELDPAVVQVLSQKLLQQQLNLKQQLAAEGVEFRTSIEEDHLAADDSFTVTVNAFVTYVKESDIPTIEKAAGVRGVYEAIEYERPHAEVDMNTSNEMIKQPVAQDLGYKGEGQVIAVIDSGVDPTHPDLQNLSPDTQPALTEEFVNSLEVPGAYVNEKVPYAYNYYDLNGNYMDIGESGHHGQHVAGTVGANGLLQGVAPESQILGMKVFSDDIQYATTFSDVYLRAIEDAILLGADVINMSLGSPAGFYTPGSIEDVAINNALENGVIVAISAGNENQIMDGSEGFADYLAYLYPLPHAKNPDVGLVGSPSINEGSLSVASVDNTHVMADKMEYMVDGEMDATAMQIAAGSPDPATSLPGPQEIVHVGANSATPGAFSDWLGLDIEGKVALVQRGNTFTDTLANAELFGAVGLIVYNHAEGGEALINMAGGDVASIPYVFIGHEAGYQLAHAEEAAILFTDEQIQSENPTAWRMSDFSSWGTGPDLQMKPEITAPGGQIYSLQNDGQYSSMSGTSMAAPHVAGGAALVQQRIKLDEIFTQLNLSDKERADLTKALLMNTADLLFDEYGFPYFVRRQGAGLMDLEGALTTEVVVVESQSKAPKVELGSLAEKQASFTLDFVNLSDEMKYYAVDYVFLKDYVANMGGVDFSLLSADYLNAELVGPRFIEVAPNTKKQPATFAYTFDFSLDELAWNSFVEGYLLFNPVARNTAGEYVAYEGSTALQMPILGFYGDWDEPKVIDEFVQNLENEDASTHPTFTFTTPVQYNPNEGLLYFRDPNGVTYMNPGSDASLNPASETLGFMATLLRNARQVNFRILDEEFEVIRTLDSYYNQRKITHMNLGQAPYTFFSDALWDGLINGRPLQDNEVVYYEVEFLRTANSTPEVYRFQIVGDNTAPTIEGLETVTEDETVYLSFSSTDTGSGGDAFSIYRLNQEMYEWLNIAMLDSTFHPLVGGVGAGFVEELAFTNVQTDFYVDITSLLTIDAPSYLYLIGYDVVGNYVDTLFGLPALPADFGAEEVAAPTVDSVSAHHTNVTGQTNAHHTVIVALPDGFTLGSGVADAKGNFNVSISPQRAGEMLYVLVESPRGFVSEPTVVVVQEAPATVDVQVVLGEDSDVVDWNEVTVVATSVDGKVQVVAENVSEQVKQFTDLFVGEYVLSVSNLPEHVQFVGPERFDATENGVLELAFEAVEVAEREPDANTQAQIVLNTPDLLTAYDTNEIRVSGLTYGLDGITSFYAGDQEILLTQVDDYSVVIGGSEVFYGTVYVFDEVITVADGYHEIPFTVSNGNPQEDFSIVRRFWVDTEAPEFDQVNVRVRHSEDGKAHITLALSDNMSVLQLRRDDNYVGTWDETANGFASTDITVELVDVVDLELGTNEFVYVLEDIAGNRTEHTVVIEYKEYKNRGQARKAEVHKRLREGKNPGRGRSKGKGHPGKGNPGKGNPGKGNSL